MRNGFPKDFLWGGAMASSQAEGGWNKGGKGLDTQDLRYFDPAWTAQERAKKENRLFRTPSCTSHAVLLSLTLIPARPIRPFVLRPCIRGFPPPQAVTVM